MLNIHVAQDSRTGKWTLSLGAGCRVKHIDLGKSPTSIDRAEALAATRLPFDPEWERKTPTYSDVTNVPEDLNVGGSS